MSLDESLYDRLSRQYPESRGPPHPKQSEDVGQIFNGPLEPSQKFTSPTFPPLKSTEGQKDYSAVLKYLIGWARRFIRINNTRDGLLCCTGWDAEYKPLPRTFKPLYFLQQPGQPRHSPQGPTREFDAQYWEDDGSLASARALSIDTEKMEQELRDWAKLQGKNGRLCPDVFMVNGERSGGWILLVDS
ncbi:MAG: hypothetical protein HETSPECPRED_002178 [Heterodermia speciosa]|uniref:Uncharacterized protein n=1 Tax=Heterodermia speciosa TaxID=116794 RepID=A0A8H3PH19_9LECA|nr:MAG: hypothetical protein HETSPECPRED_002178 [Heterodermia speciosa]